MKSYIHFIPNLSPGGAENQLVNLAIEEKKLGLNPIVVTLASSDSHLLTKLQNADVKIKAFELAGLSLIYSLVSLLIFCFRIDNKKYVVASWMYHCMFLSIFIKLIKPNLKIIWLVRRTSVPKGVTGFISKLCSFFSKVIPSKILCNSNAGLKSHEESNYCSSKLAFVPNMFDITLFDFNSAEIQKKSQDLKIPNQVKVIGVIGRFHPVKGHLNFLKALSLINAKQEYICLMIGRGIEEQAEIKSFLIKNDYLARKIIFLGERSDVNQLLHLIDFLVLPSLSEGFPNVVAEAMCCSKPCVVTNVGDSAHIVADTGFIVPPNDNNLLAKAITTCLIMTNEEISNLGIKAKLRISNNFTTTKVVKYYLDFLVGE